jgi:hypothetical protein
MSGCATNGGPTAIPTMTPLPTPIPGISFTGDDWTDEEKAAVFEGVQWSMDFLGSKAYSGLGLNGKGIELKLSRNNDNTNDDKQKLKVELYSSAWAGYISVALPKLTDVSFVGRIFLRTLVIHEMGHFVDYYAGLPLGFDFGITTDINRTDKSMKESPYWVGEWKWHGDHRWEYTGPDPDDLPSNYLWNKDAQLCTLYACPSEDFAETFTWMVYDHRQSTIASGQEIPLDKLDPVFNYQRPSLSRQKAVLRIISLLP